MKRLKWVLPAIAVAALVVACGGGGGDAGTSPFGGSSACASTSASAATSACTTASNLTLQLSSSSILNGGAATVTATATATTSSGQAVSGIPVFFSVDNGATFTQTGSTTSATGQAVATVSVGADPSNRVITVKASSGNLTSSAPFAVTGSVLTATGSAVVAPGTPNQVFFRLTNSNGAGIPNQEVSVVAGSIAPTSGTTDTNGNYTYNYTAPTTPVTLDIVGSSGGVDKTLTVLVQSGAGSIAPAVGPINSASVSANPSVVSTNTPASNNRTEIRALFVGPGNASIARVRVRFDLDGDQNNIGGTFSTTSSVIYSDANGVATTAYIPGSKASPTNGVTIRACYDITDFAPGTCPNATRATVTVASDPLSVTIGSNNLIIKGPNDLTYRRQFVVLVVDASGRAKANVDVVPSIDLPIYFKGQYVRGAEWVTGERVNATTVQEIDPVACINEDLNRNGVLESAEDINLSGSIEPRKSDATITILGTGKTDENGSAVVQVEYPQNVASWLQVKILVSATGVSGTEGRAFWTEILPVPTDTLTATSTPPFVVSPYGVVIRDGNGNLGPPYDAATAPCRNKN